MTLQRLKQSIESEFIQRQQHGITGTGFKTVCELMVHPGFKSVIGTGGCGEGPDLFACSDDREHELATLQSPGLKDYLKFNNIRTCSFKEL